MSSRGQLCSKRTAVPRTVRASTQALRGVMVLADEGTLAFWVRRPPQRPDVFYDPLPCSFPPVVREGLTAEVTKHRDCTVTVRVSGLHQRTYTFTRPIPLCDDRGLLVVVVWGATGATLYLNGRAVQRIQVAAH